MNPRLVYLIQWWSRFCNIVCLAVFQKNLLFASSEDTLKMEMVCFYRTVSIPDYFVSLWKDTIWLLKLCH